MSHLLVGEDPTRVEYLWQMMYRQRFWHGHGIVRATAIAGIDLALWDIVGNVANMPLSKVFGGPVRDWVRTYCHFGGGKMEDFYQTLADNAKRFAELAQQAVGPDIDIMVDCHARPSLAMGLKFGKALDDLGLYFFEEPCWPEAVDGLAKINAALTTPVASGERVTNLETFKDMFEKRAVEICQLDITHCGGLSAAKRIAALAEAHRIALAPHNPQGPVSTVASLEFGFSQQSYIICETVHNNVPWRQEVVEEGFTIETKGRIVRPNTKPGLGITINEAEVKKHPFQQEIVLREFSPDGAVTDW